MRFFFDSAVGDNAQVLFGSQIQKYRKAAKITQQDFAALMETSDSYVSALEKGKANPNLEIIARYSSFFGVSIDVLFNPDILPKAFPQLPKATIKAIGDLERHKNKHKQIQGQRKLKQKEEGVPGRAKQLHALLAAGFFKKPRTAKAAFEKLHPAVKKVELHLHAEEYKKITTTLSQGKFVKLLDKLEPAPNSTEVRFVIKNPSVVKYLDEPAGTKDMAADGE